VPRVSSFELPISAKPLGQNPASLEGDTLDIEKRRKAGKLPGVKIDGGRIRNPVQETLIIDIIGDNFPWLDQIREIETNQQLTKPQLMRTC
jgi:hypothetical protein